MTMFLLLCCYGNYDLVSSSVFNIFRGRIWRPYCCKLGSFKFSCRILTNIGDYIELSDEVNDNGTLRRWKFLDFSSIEMLASRVDDIMYHILVSVMWVSMWKSGSFITRDGELIMILFGVYDRIGLSVSTTGRTYKLTEVTPATPLHTCRFHSTGICNYKSLKRTYRMITCSRYGLTIRKYWAQSNASHSYGRVSHGLFPRVCRYGLLYLRTVERDLCLCLCVYLFVCHEVCPDDFNYERPVSHKPYLAGM